jgi:hypothetical protein
LAALYKFAEVEDDGLKIYNGFLKQIVLIGTRTPLYKKEDQPLLRNIEYLKSYK